MLRVVRRWLDQIIVNEEALSLVAIMVVIALLAWSVGDIVAPVFAALVIAYLLYGLVKMLIAKGVNHSLGVAIVFSLFLGFLLLLIFLVLPSLWKQSVQLLNELPGIIVKTKALLMVLPQQYPDLISVAQVESWLTSLRDELSSLGQVVLSFSLSGLAGFISVLVYCVLVPVLVFFFLKDAPMMKTWLMSLMPKRRDSLRKIGHEMEGQIANYVRGKAIEIILVGGVTYITFVVFGLNYAELLAISVGLSVLVPFIGAAVVTLPVVIVAYVQWGTSDMFVYLIIAHAIIQGIDGNVVVPWLFSEVTNMHPVAIILAVLVFGGLWGFWGVFFAIPLATLLKAIITSWPKGGEWQESVQTND